MTAGAPRVGPLSPIDPGDRFISIDGGPPESPHAADSLPIFFSLIAHFRVIVECVSCGVR